MERRGSAGGLSTFSASSVASSGDEERRSSTLDVPRPPQKRRSLRTSLKPSRAPQLAAQVPGVSANELAMIGSFSSEPHEAQPRSPKLVASPTSSKFFSLLGPHPRESSVTPLSTSPSKGIRKAHQRSNTTTSFEVKETHTMYKDYDPTTGNKKINKYMLIKEIGRGVHGKVKLGRDVETDGLVAIKIVDRTSRRRLGRNNELTTEQKIRKEIAILKKCAHPNVVRLIEVIDDPMSRKIYIVLEYMEGGEVRWRDEHGKPIMEIQEARRTFREVVLGLEYLHHQGIIHRDIKPANLLLSDDGVVKISDFGVSYFSQRAAASADGVSRNPASPESELSKTAGSPAFFAPELCFTGDVSIDLSAGSLASALANSDSSVVASAIQSRTHRPPITKAIDVWALGVTLYCFVFGRAPFIAETEFELFFNVIPRKPLEFPVDIPVSDGLRDLLSRLLEKDATKRITLEEVKKHPWVVADLPDPEKWRQETDPHNYKAVTVTDEEVKSAYTLVDRLKKKFRKISVSLGHLTLGHLRKRSKSASAASPESSDSYSHSDTSATTATSAVGGTVPIAICPPQSHLDPGHSRHASIFGSSYPEEYTRRISNDKNFRSDDARSLSFSSGLSVARSVGSMDRPDYYLNRQSPPRHLVVKRRSNHSYSSLSQSWAEDDFKKGVNDGREGGGVRGTPDSDVGSRQDHPGNGSASDGVGHRRGTSEHVYGRRSSQGGSSATYLSLAPPPPTFTGVRSLPLERFETSDTVESDDSGLVFGSMAAQGSYRS